MQNNTKAYNIKRQNSFLGFKHKECRLEFKDEKGLV
jgi:hypothetical protein